MYYVSNESLIESIKQLHLSGTHESFRNYLVLKAYGLKFGVDDPVVITTTNTTPTLQLLFGLEGLPDETPFYNPLLNELMKDDAARGIIQTNIKKYHDEATKTKMTWAMISQGANREWLVKFSDEYPISLGRGEAGLAARDDIQITIHAPSFALWIARNDEFKEKPSLEQLWSRVVEQLNFHAIESDLIFTKPRDFDADPFVDVKPNRKDLVDWILKEESRGSNRDVLKLPNRRAFVPERIQRIISSHKSIGQTQMWWTARDISKEAIETLELTRALLIVGPPGTGKTRLALQIANEIVGKDPSQVHLFQFHATYAYEDFIEALVPKPDGGSIKFEPVIKRFAEICDKARTQRQVVILDELNRADVSKVFGEAFLLIEREYRDEKNAIPFLHTPNKKFWIPPDLYLVATLNDLDKSTYDLDFAFRRRFGQIEATPNTDALENVVRNAGCNDQDFIRILRGMFNGTQQIYPLGHAYFKSVKDRETLRATYRRVIRPTIKAYLGQYRKDDLDRVDAIFKRACEVMSWEEYIGIENSE